MLRDSSESIHRTGHRGRAVLLLHGLCGNPLELQPLAQRLHQDGYTVRAPLIEGYGVSARSPSETRMRSHAEWIEEAARHMQDLRKTHGQVVVGGLCIGANLGAALAARGCADALLLISPTLYFDGWAVSPWRRLLPLAYVWPLREWLSFREHAPFGLKDERLRAWIETAMRRSAVSAAGAARLPAAGLREAQRLIDHVKRSLPQIGVPTQILHAVDDDVTSPRSVHLLQARLARAPDVTWFHDSYHMLTLDREREQVAQASLRFLRGLPAADLPMRLAEAA
jgi:carboxylesterase